MSPQLRPLLILALLAPLAGCSGVGGFAWHTFYPFHTAHRVKDEATNVARAHGKSPASAKLTPQPGQPWPTSYPVDPTIMDIERSGNGVP